VRRSPKFSAQGLVLSLWKAVQTGKSSFNQLATLLGMSEPRTMSRQALWNRIDDKALSFMVRVTGEAIKDRWGDELLVASGKFSRVIVEDSSQAKTHRNNAEDFPAHGNDGGRTAGCKFDLSFDLLTGEPISEALHLATEQDRELGKDVVDLVGENDLILRDMGYFSLGEFARIEAGGAFWLSRLPVSVKARDDNGRNLETMLRTTKANRIDCEMFIGDALHPTRLVAVRAAPEVARERRRKRREQARRNGRTPGKDVLLRDGWHILITNVSAEVMAADGLIKLYSARWQIEIVFRAWKQSGHLMEALARRSNPFHLQCLMYAALLLLILTLKVTSLLRRAHRQYQLSIEKIAKHLAAFILSLRCLFDFSAYDPDPRHLKMDKRSRKSLHQTTAPCLG
jgi:hypothetical protein